MFIINMLLQIAKLIEPSNAADFRAYKWLLICMDPKMGIELKYTFKYF